MNTHILLTDISFNWPWLLLLLPLPIVLRLLLKPSEKMLFEQKNESLNVPFFNQLIHSRQMPKKTQWFKLILLSTIWGLAILSMARPSVVIDEVELPVQARDIMMAIDLSESMRQNYLTGGRANRLDVVKAAADTFIKRRENDRIGLVFFSDRAYVQSPLTLDNILVRELLTEAQVGLTGRATAIGDAIAVSLKRFKQTVSNNNGQKISQELGNHSQSDYNNKVIILLTDGANTAGELSPEIATELAKKMGVKIYTIGVGKDVNGLFSGRKELDEDLLKQIANTTGGQFFRAQNKKSLDQIYHAISQLEPTEQAQPILKISKELFYYPMGLALVLSLLALSLLLIPSLFYRFKQRQKIGDAS